MTKRKLVFIVLVCCITPFITILLANYHAFTEITTSCVDPLDGDVSFAFYNGKGIIVKSFNKSGELLFSKFFDSDGGGSIYMKYVESNLCIFISRTNAEFIYDSNMDYVSKSDAPDLYNFFVTSQEESYWDGWIISGTSKKYSVGGLTYCYEESSPLLRLLKRGNCKFYIQDSNNKQIILYQSTSE